MAAVVEVGPSPHGLSVPVLRDLFRGLQAFWSFYEDFGQDTITTRAGQSFCLWDVVYLYRQVPRLPTRQGQAIEMFLVRNIKEKQVAILMGLKPTNPVAMYATDGCTRLIEWVEDGLLPNFQVQAAWNREAVA